MARRHFRSGLLVHPVTPPFVPGGGISTAIAGSAKTVGLALVMAAPVGLLCALFLYERAGRLAGTLRFSADVLSGVPSIVIGIFAYEVVVRPMHHASGLAASIALAILMLPIMVRADEEAIRSVPVDLQEAGAALGAPRWRVVRRVVLRGSLPGLVAGNLLALAQVHRRDGAVAVHLGLTDLGHDAAHLHGWRTAVHFGPGGGLGHRPGAAGRRAGLERPGACHRLVAYKEGEMTAVPTWTPWRRAGRRRGADERPALSFGTSPSASAPTSPCGA